MKTIHSKLAAPFLFLLIFSFTSAEVWAHCDRKNGPVAVAAKEALQSGEIDKIMIWVGEEQEGELTKKFHQSLAVYKQGGKSKELAEEYFMEISVRLHREAEGLPFTGLKEAQPNPKDIAAAEQALDSGDIELLIDLLSKEMEQKISHWFMEARQAKIKKNNSIEAGREWVNTYVKFITYIHKLYQTIEQGPPHGVGEQGE